MRAATLIIVATAVIMLVISAVTAATEVGSAEPLSPGHSAVCPVTGAEFTITAETEHSEYQGKHYYFCCPGCSPLFDSAPEKYVK